MGRLLLGWFVGVTLVYSVLFGTGYLLFGRPLAGFVCFAVAGVAGVALWRLTGALTSKRS